MTARLNLTITAELPAELAKAFLQHLRDFDVRHPGCQFELAGVAADSQLVDIVEAMNIDPPLAATAIYRSKP